LAKIKNTAFQDAQFIDCKLLGLHFDDCNKLGLSLSFVNCQLNLTSFYKLNLKNRKFSNCNLQEADFTGADLSNSAFDNCELSGAHFEGSILEKVDFRTAFGYAFDPELNRVQKAKFSLDGIPGLLQKYQIDIE
jgi:uncharacterized protein YjbI with pentapeptide repeats